MEITGSTIETLRHEASADPQKFCAAAGEMLPLHRGWDFLPELCSQ